MKYFFIICAFFLLFGGCQRKQLDTMESSDLDDSDMTVQEVYLDQAEEEIKEEIKEKKDEPVEDLARMYLGRNPFMTSEEEELFKKEGTGVGVIDYLNLSGSFHSPGYSYAIIDGRIVKENDIIDNKKIVKIGKEEVILKDSYGNEYSIKTKNIVN